MTIGGDDTIKALREALKLTPDNARLRRHLAETLLAFGHAGEAEAEFRRVIAQSPGDTDAKLGLARAYLAQDRASHAIVVLEEMVKHAPTGRARVLYARALLRDGDPERAGAQYRRGVEDDPSAADSTLAEELGVTPAPSRPAAKEEEHEPWRGEPDEARGSAHTPIERPTTDFADVGGMERVKDEIRMKIIHPLEHPELYQAYGKAIGGGILLYGPPGCGKTHLARATAGQVKARFLSVGISDVLNMWMGESERNLHELFEQARAHKPCVLFFDEVDALGASRGDLRHSSARHLVNQFLNELDGIDSRNDGVLVLAATNAPWHVDSAFRRPGRFDRIIFVPPPDEPARAAIVRIMLKGKPTDGVDADAIAKKADGFSGADLKNLVDLTIEDKLREAIKRGTAEPITTKDLLRAVKGVKPSTREWFATAKNHALYANQAGLYDDVLEFLKQR
ncbi:MAG: AAA family ATPase [Phycisphaerales bacterium]|nr:AAA family ATPase [Phycisphaerales bacterium]